MKKRRVKKAKKSNLENWSAISHKWSKFGKNLLGGKTFVNKKTINSHLGLLWSSDIFHETLTKTKIGVQQKFETMKAWIFLQASMSKFFPNPHLVQDFISMDINLSCILPNFGIEIFGHESSQVVPLAFLVEVGHLQESEQLLHGFNLKDMAMMLELMTYHCKLHNYECIISFELFLYMKRSNAQVRTLLHTRKAYMKIWKHGKGGKGGGYLLFGEWWAVWRPCIVDMNNLEMAAFRMYHSYFLHSNVANQPFLPFSSVFDKGIKFNT